MTATVSTPQSGHSEDLLALAASVLEQATGAEQVEVLLSRASSTTVKVYEGEVESLTSADSSGAGIRIIRDGRLGFAHCGSLDPTVLAETLREARDNLEFAEPDEWNGLAQPDGVEVVAQNGWSDSVVAFPVDRKISLALELEQRVLAADSRITGIRSTAYGDAWGESVILSSAGIQAVDRGASCSISTQPLARVGEETQTGFGYDSGRVPESLDLDHATAEAVDRATRLLGAVKPPSARMTILLEPRLAISLMGIVSGMLSGESVLKGRSPFGERLGEQIASALLSLTDDPTQSESIGAEEVDGEGLACRSNLLISNGVLQGFLQDSYSGRRSGLASTGSAVRGTRSLPGVGAQLLVMQPGTRSFEQLVSSIDLGLYVNSLSGMHSGVNSISGDFSVGADGLMIRNGSIAEPVRELTLASTLQRLLLDISEVGGDFEWLRGGDGACSLVIQDVSLSGA